MANNLHSPSYNGVEKLDLKSRHLSIPGYSRRKNNSCCSIQTPEKGLSNAVNYYSDNASSFVQSSVKKSKSRRSLSLSPPLYSHYAGAKFSEPPPPSVLPLPPTHWTELAAWNAVVNIPTPRPATPDCSCSSTPISSLFAASSPNKDESVDLFFQKCSFTHLETCKDFTKQLKTLLNVPA